MKAEEAASEPAIYERISNGPFLKSHPQELNALKRKEKAAPNICNYIYANIWFL